MLEYNVTISIEMLIIIILKISLQRVWDTSILN
jgi:hypothetical protein